MRVAAQEVKPVCAEALVISTYDKQIGWRLADLVLQSSWEKIAHNSDPVPIYGIDWGARYVDYKNHREQLHKDYRESLSINQETNVAWTGLDPLAPAAYHDCLEYDVFSQTGLHAAARLATQENITITIRWYGSRQPESEIEWQGSPPKAAQRVIRKLPKKVISYRSGAVPRPSREIVITGHAPGYDTKIVLVPVPKRVSPPPIPEDPYIGGTIQTQFHLHVDAST
jgi:hypothetical protein